MSSSEIDKRIAFRRFAQVRVEMNSANVYLVTRNKQMYFEYVACLCLSEQSTRDGAAYSIHIETIYFRLIVYRMTMAMIDKHWAVNRSQMEFIWNLRMAKSEPYAQLTLPASSQTHHISKCFCLYNYQDWPMLVCRLIASKTFIQTEWNKSVKFRSRIHNFFTFTTVALIFAPL